ncbi:MAG: glycosyltransferase [Leptospirales bacterium]|nr:glycosyltransferase [Leptospirales bacterium]
MNVLYIPSWFPSRNSQAGSFFLEWADAIQELSDVKLAICSFGNLEIQFQHPIKTIQNCIGELFASQTAARYRSSVLRYTHKLGFPDRAYARAARKMFLRARAELGSIELIHAQVGYPAGYAAWRLWQEFGIPYVITEVMGPFPFPVLMNGDRLASRIHNPMKNAARIMAISPSLQKTIESFGFSNVISVPGFVDERMFYPSEQEITEPIFFALSNLSVAKGTDDLLEAIRIVTQQHRRRVLVRIGGPGDHAHYEAMARRLQIEKQVEFLGPVPRQQAAVEFRKAFAFVLPSRLETFGMVYAEALASGLPVIAARAGGPESIVDSTNGILVPVADPPAIAQAMIAIIDQRSRFKTSEIRAGFMRRFARAVVVERVRQVYEEALSSGSARI